MADSHDAVTTVNLDASPFQLPPIEGLPFARDSEEARAIERVIEESKQQRERAGDDPSE
jgi:hypothetical protein